MDPDQDPDQDNQENMRLHEIPAKCRDPVLASHSDFVYAVAPVLGIFFDQTEEISDEEMNEQQRKFNKIFWGAWKAVWLDGQGQHTKRTLFRDIGWEFRLHLAHVGNGSKAEVVWSQDTSWEEALEGAIKTSCFERWADPDYVEEVWPQGPTPPPSPVEEFKNLVWDWSIQRAEAAAREAKEARRREWEARIPAEDRWENSWNH